MKRITNFLIKRKPKLNYGKTLLIILLISGFQFTRVLGQSLYEDFNYTIGDNIGGNTNASGTTNNNWTTHSNIQAGTINVISGSLSYIGLTASSGNRVNIPAANGTVPRDVNRNASMAASQNITYASCLVNVIDASQLSTSATFFTNGANGNFFHLSTNSTTFFARTSIRATNGATTFRLGISNFGNVYTEFPTDLAFGTTYLIVLKYEFISPGTDVATLWVNPATLGGTEPGGSVTNSSSTGNVASYNSLNTAINIRNSSSTPKADIDEIRVGTTYAQVTPTSTGVTATLADISQPTGPIIQGANDVVLAGFTLSASSSVDFSAVTVTGAGTANASDLSSVRIFRDNDGNGMIDGADASVSGAGTTYAASMPFTISGETGITTTRNYLIVANVELLSTAGNDVTVSIAPSAFTTTAGTNAGSATGNQRVITSAVTPTITVTGTLTPFTTSQGTPSASQSYMVEGVNLADNITITPPADFEIRTGVNAYSNTPLVLNHTGGTVAQTTIDVQYNPAVAGSTSGNITHTSPGAVQKDQAVSGSSVAAEPTTQAAVTFGAVTNNSIVVNFSGGDGSARIVVVRNANAVSYTPFDGFSATGVNSHYFAATDKGSGNKIVYDGTGNTVTVTGLDMSTVYHVAVYEYNGTAATTNYLTTGAGINNTSTTAKVIVPVPMASQMSLTYTENFTDEANWGNGFNFGTGTAPWGHVGVNGAGTIPDGVRTTVSTATFTNSSTTGGLQRGSLVATGSNNVPGTIVQLSTGATNPTDPPTNSNAIEIFLDYTGVVAGSLSFDWAVVFNGTGDRAGSLRVYTSTDGATYTELTGAAVLNKANNVAASGSVTSVSLPPAFSNSSTARIRFYEYNGVGGVSGSRPKFSIDDVVVTATTTPAKLAITNINPPSPTQGVGFSVTVESHDNSNTPQNVVSNTDVTLSLNTGTGALGGTLTGTILAGTSSVVISGVTYNTVENGVIITATSTAGDNLTADNSDPFNVVAPAPVITVTGTLNEFLTAVSTNSPSQTYTVEAQFLTNNLLISPPAQFEISLDDMVWTSNPNSITIVPSSGTVATTTIYARYSPTAAGPHTGDISHQSTGATTQVQPVSGATVASEPTTASTVTIGCPAINSLVVNFTGGDGTSRIVVARESNPVTFTPADGTPPSGVNSDFSLAADQGSGNKIVYDGSGSTVTVTGLSGATTYFFTVYEYNGSGSITEYLTSSFGSGDNTTLGGNSYSVTGSTYTQDFDGLPSTGTFSLSGIGPHYVSACPIQATNATGWQFGKDAALGGTGSNATFIVDNGGGNTGAAYSYGSNLNPNRSIGSLASSGVISTLGLVLVNNTADALQTVTISYYGEQWRNGGSGIINKLLFSYSVGASGILSGTFNTVPSLDLPSTVVSTNPNGVALDGDAMANRTLVSETFTLNTNWLPGQTLVIRWVDANDAGSDDGLAIDDFNFSATTPLAPTAQDNNISFSNIATTSVQVDWINGDGANRIVKINTVNSFIDPADGIDYPANSVYGGGEQVVFNGSASPLTVTNLTPGQTYHFRVYGFNGAGISSRYITTTATLNPNSVMTTNPIPPTKLVILSVNNGNNPIVGQPFDVVVQSQDAGNNPQNVSSNTTVDLSIFAGTGSLSGTTSGVITMGSNMITISGVIYTPAENSVQLEAASSAGDVLDPGQSATFDVLDVASTLAFATVPGNGVVNTNVGNIVVEARRPNNSVDPNYAGTVTLSVNSGPGNISGTLAKPLVSGTVTFSDIQFDMPGTYTLLATTTGISSAVSTSIIITAPAVLTELVVPKFMGSKSTASANTTRTPIAVCLKIDNLVPNTLYDIRAGFELVSGLATSYGAGNIYNSDSSFASVNIQNVFTTDANGSSGPFWIHLQPTGNSSRFDAGQVHNLRIGYTIDGQSMPSTPSFIGTQHITALDIAPTQRTATTDDDGAYLHGVTGDCVGGKFLLVYDNSAGTGQPLYSYRVRPAIPDTANANYSGHPTQIFNTYLSDGTGVDGEWPAVVPIGLNNPNGVRRVEARNADNSIFGFSTDDDGIWPSGANTTNNTRRSVTSITITDAPIASCGVEFSSRVLIQGYYSGGGFMETAGSGTLFVSGESADPTDSDTLSISIMEAASPYNHVETQKGIMKTNGNISVTFSSAVVAGNSYWVKINHRNSVETWSAAPIVISSVTSYLFTTAATQAFADNMVETFDQMGFAIYSGDINQDGSVDGSDFLDLDPSIQNGDGGYAVGDLNGDGSVDGSDFLVLDPNIQNGIGAAVPAP